jgi:hypothetical protein
MGMCMFALYRETHFTFRFGDDRQISRFHLEGIPPGTPVRIFRLDERTETFGEVLATTTVGDAGWVEIAEPILVRAGIGFVAIPALPDPEPHGGTP